MFTDADGRIQPIWAFAVSGLLSAAAFLVAGYAAASIAGNHVLRFEAIFRPLLAVLLLAIFSWLLTVGQHIEDQRIAAQGLPLSPGSLRQFGVGCAIGVFLVMLAVVPIAIGSSWSIRTTVNSVSLARAAIVFLIVISGALAEELMFRGYPFQRLVEAVGASGAIVVFSTLFGVVHLSNPGASVWGLIITIAIGVLLSVTYLRTRALWMPWGIHFAWNLLLGLILGLPVSGLRLFNVAVHSTVRGPKWLTGGSYGIEASAPGAVAVLIGLVLVWKAPLGPLQGRALSSPSENRVEPDPPEVSNERASSSPE
jgi:membrane protease YdiL (CAAX protease family)